MSQTRLGTSVGPWMVEEGVETNINQGGNTTQTWEGSESEVAAKRLALLAAGATRIQYRSKGDGNYIVTASWPYDFANPSTSSYVDTLELETNVVQRSIYQSPIFRKRFSDYNSTTSYSARANKVCSIVQKAVQILQSLQPTIKKEAAATNTQKLTVKQPSYYVTDRATGTDHAYDTAEAAAEAYLNDRLFYLYLSADETAAATYLFYEIGYMGVTSFWEFGTVFRRTVTASVPSAISANNVGVGMIWTSAEVSAYEGIPSSGGWFTLPSGKQWIKDKPRVLKSYGQKTQISYNYTEIVSASALAYEAYGTAILIHA